MANSPTTDLAAHLAHNLQALRKQRGLTQAMLAKIAGLPRSTLTHIESGSGNPSLNNLAAISAGLQVPLEELLSRPRGEIQKLSRAEIPQVKRSGGQVLVNKLLPDSIPGMDFDQMIFQPQSRMGGIPHLPTTKEYLFCQKGQIRVHVAGEEFRLDSGEVLAFPGDRPHSYHAGPQGAQCLSVVVLAPTLHA